MSIVPDLLLQPAVKAKPRGVPAKAQAPAPEPSQRKAASFAQVYARERQDKPVERAEPVAKGARERFSGCCDDASSATEPLSEQEQIAASGKPLPDDATATTATIMTADEDAEPATELDPLLLLAISGQLPTVEVSPAALAAIGTVQPAAEDATAQPALTGLTPAVAGLVSSATAAMTDASHDATLDSLTSAAGVQLVVDLGVKAQLAAQTAAQQAGGAAVAQGAADVTQDFAGALLAAGQPTAETKLGEGALAELKALGVEGADSRKDASPEPRTENLTARLSALSQAIGQQTPATSRLGLIPGQPLAMQQGGWSEAVVDKVMWLSSQNLKSAEIQLDPAELGRLEVRVDISKEQTQVTFASPHAGVRDALEGQMQRLRDLFTAQGMNLLDVNVSDQSMNRGWQGQEQQGGGGDGSRRGGSAGGLLAAGDDEHVNAVTELRGTSLAASRSLVDYYA
ncbi:MAG: flagellar hook-length control protein FliK [Pseudomonas sp.]|uniref:flagellar hook-length control protein FliK n=1 Tax=Pseudomonas sp. TaxID=306 RepID=UPI002732F631|nr:flagellar hook-length control protein FliK [Pseudomonas sp.]MDP3845999.1 flagellar hook-length control protein FliK [Pseudomonas sp.]